MNSACNTERRSQMAIDDYYAYYTQSRDRGKKRPTMADLLRDVEKPGEPFSYGQNIPEKYRYVNPQTIADMTEREKRKLYSELRSIARKRADRLEAKGYEVRRFDQVSKVPSGDLDEQLAEVAYYLRSPGSSISAIKKEKEQASLAAHGYHVEDVRSYGKFMEMIRYRYRNRKIRDSDPFYMIYVEAVEKRKMSIKTLQREFGKYLNEEEEAKKLKNALLSAPERTDKRDRLTAKNLKDILDLK